MSGRINPIIQAFLAARDQATRDFQIKQQNEQFQQRQEQEQQQFERSRQLQEAYQKSHFDYLSKQIALNKARHELEVKSSLMKGEIPGDITYAEGGRNVVDPLQSDIQITDPTTGVTSSITPSEYMEQQRQFAQLAGKTETDILSERLKRQLEITQPYKLEELSTKALIDRAKWEEQRERVEEFQRERDEYRAERSAERAKISQDIARDNKLTQIGISFQKDYEAHPTTKRLDVALDSYKFINEMANQTKNPADDIGLIYAFAKGMDLESVVREGEYDTVQKYAQALLKRAGYSAQRVFTETGFLSPRARQFLKDTLRDRIKSTYKAHKIYRKAQLNKMNKMTGRPDMVENLMPDRFEDPAYADLMDKEPIGYSATGEPIYEE